MPPDAPLPSRPDGPDDREWDRLLAILADLEARHALQDLDSLDLDRLLAGRDLAVPAWFRGLGRARKKLMAKSDHGQRMLATTEMAEMASPGPVARHRFAGLGDRLARTSRIDLPACGAGVDGMELLTLLEARGLDIPVHASDPDDLACRMFRHNAAALFPGRRVQVERAAFPPPTGGAEGVFCFLDPARRHDGRRGGYAPALAEAFAGLTAYDMAMLKLAPAEDLDALAAAAPDWRWEVVEYGGEIKEVSGRRDRNQAADGTRIATVLAADGRATSHAARPVEPGAVPEVALETGLALAIPCKALLRAGLADAWAAGSGLRRAAGCHGLYAGDAAPGPLARVRVLEARSPARERDARDLLRGLDGPLEFMARGAAPPSWLPGLLRPALSRPAEPAGRRLLLLARTGNATTLLLLR